MAIVTQKHEYTHNDQRFIGFLAYDEENNGPRPAVLVAHTWEGCNELVKNSAIELAKLGYVAMALDMYGDGLVGEGPKQCSALMQPLLDDRQLLRDRVAAGLKALRELPLVDDKQVAAVGYCFGGLCVLDLARCGADIAGVVSFHALLDPAPIATVDKIKAKVLVLHGHDDPMVKPDVVLAFEQEMTDAGADWQLHVYGGTVHAFTNPEANMPEFGALYNPLAAMRSWQSMASFLEELFEQ